MKIAFMVIKLFDQTIRYWSFEPEFMLNLFQPEIIYKNFSQASIFFHIHGPESHPITLDKWGAIKEYMSPAFNPRMQHLV